MYIKCHLDVCDPSNITVSLRAGEVSFPIHDHADVAFLEQDTQSLKDVS